MTDLLKLKAKDAEDVQVVSAVLQDAIAPVVDMDYRAADKNFIMVVQRLCREDPAKERICCALNLRGVESVQTHGFHPAETERMLDLLAIMPEGDVLQLIFASDARIRFRLKDWSLMIEDFGARWPAHCEPCHESTGKF
jgi:Protein of unknown function (DUF2948)